MTVRGKFFVLGIEKHSPKDESIRIRLGAVSPTADEFSENTMYHQFTPSGSIDMHVNNPAAVSQFSLGQEFYVDFTPVVQKPSAT